MAQIGKVFGIALVDLTTGEFKVAELEAPRTLVNELYRLRPDGSSEELYGDVGLTNGIGFSPAGDLLYHSDSAIPAVTVADVGADGKVSGKRVFAPIDGGIPDGLAVDEAGCVWVAVYGAGAALRFAPDGGVDRRLDVPAVSVTSLCLGGSDLRGSNDELSERRLDV